MINKAFQQAHGQQAFFGSQLPKIFSRFPDRRIIGRLGLLMRYSTMAIAAILSASSDRIVQDPHLIPFYPRIVAQAALNLRGTENFFIVFELYPVSSYLFSAPISYPNLFKHLLSQIFDVKFRRTAEYGRENDIPVYSAIPIEKKGTPLLLL